MSRENRFQYLASFFRPPKIQPRPVRERRLPVPIKSWAYRLSGDQPVCIVSAYTRSEARARIKQIHGIRGRLPIGTVIDLITYNSLRVSPSP